MKEQLLTAYPVVIETPVAWGEMDSLRHVNNIVYFRYFESARMAYFERVGYWELMDATGLGPILAETRCKFRLPLTYPDTVSVGARVTDIQADRFLMRYAVYSHNHRKLAAEGDGLVVSYNYRTLTKAPLPEVIRRRIEELESPSDKET